MSRPASMDRKLVLVTGGHGFIGSHVAQRLFRSDEYRVRIADLTTSPPSNFGVDPICHEVMIGNLCDPDFSRAAVHGVSVVLHFAANMGGMGTIHDANDFTIYRENHVMTLALLEASLKAGVETFLYASTACVYPEHLQSPTSSRSSSASFSSSAISFVAVPTPSSPVALREDDAYDNVSSEHPPSPQGLYGLEKLATEHLLHQFSSKLAIRIARFHNVYGPGGSWNNGREKAPAALLRKALALSRLAAASSPDDRSPANLPPFEIWGDGTQLRSFLYIDDAVDALIRLLDPATHYSFPLNIGSDNAISIIQLARVALSSAGLNPSLITFKLEEDRPVGVASRNSDNTRVTQVLDWAPSTTHADGLKKTCEWMAGELDSVLVGLDQERRLQALHGMLSSTVVDLKEQDVVFAILLPITSRGATSPDACLANLQRFAESLLNTTWRDTHTFGGKNYRLAIYLAIDHDDDFLLPLKDDRGKAEDVLRRAGFANVKTLVCNVPRGHVCELWRICATQAWKDGCDYLGLFGDDVELLDEGWMRRVDQEFASIAKEEGLPHGIGCVAFTDVSFPGMPTFPIIHRRHMDVFGGIVVPEVFINQDGDPYLYQLYRRWNASRMMDLRLSNGIGGSDDARYEKHHATAWTFDTLSNGVNAVDAHIKYLSPSTSRTLTLDIIVPCYRVDLVILKTILSLAHSRTLTVMFIIIIDNPSSPHIAALEKLYGARPDIRIRTHPSNLGASASRNRGMRESSAEWVHFLDDDVVPEPNLLFEDEKVIRAHPNAAGFVGLTLFPPSTTVFQTAVHLAGVTYFWDIAQKIADDVPWGVTANLIARRNVPDGVEYDTRYPKTGGGEDIEFCRLKRAKSLQRGGEGFMAAPGVVVGHPWWNKGKRSYWRFYMWAYGDGMLVARFPELSYRDYSPNSAEWLLLTAVVPLLLAPFVSRFTQLVALAVASVKFAAAVVVVNVAYDLYRHLLQHPERDATLDTTVRSPVLYGLALVESTLIRVFSELGRLKGMLDRGEWSCIGKRFDWFAGRVGDGPRREERKVNFEKSIVVILVGFFFLKWVV